ncbi:hypothetical protein ND748_13420 [Frankia sp. AiPs1]|uniref:hypothetical protein n=1 Tax=Frankia sp. AiPs1 TaxID=573493 RepID=UPI0020438494|nr:hypothetical protein [Frankia sp. AiPs1]MCM3922655.1 hypothetical protein [Frankia sp. AiPs1]
MPDDRVDTGPLAIERWLLKTSRMASADPFVHVGARFSRSFGRDASFVSRIEGGTRRLPVTLRALWFDRIGLDRAEVDHHLAERLLDSSSLPAASSAGPAVSESDLELFDAALHGATLSPRQWGPACRAAAASGLPRTIIDFCDIGLEALAVASPSDYSKLVVGLAFLPAQTLVAGVRRVVEKISSRGYQVIDLLAAVEGDHAGSLLLEYLHKIPDPWMLRSVAEAMRRLTERRQLTFGPDGVRRFQAELFDHVLGAPSWTSRIELTNLLGSLGPVPADIYRRLTDDVDMDVRIAAGVPAEQSVEAVADDLYATAVLPVLDSMPGRVDIEDQTARTLVVDMIYGRSRRRRVQAAQALGLSVYRHRLAEGLAGLLGSQVIELRRTAAQALMYFPPTDSTATALARCAGSDVNPDVRGRATWSLTPHARALDTALLDTMLADGDESVRRCAVDLSAAAGHLSGLRLAASDLTSPRVAANAAALADWIALQSSGGDR